MFDFMLVYAGFMQGLCSVYAGILLFRIPNLPGSPRLTQQHSDAVLDGCSLRFAFLQKEGLFGIIHAVKEQVPRGDEFVWDCGTTVHIRQHAQRRTIDDHGMGCHHFLIQFLIP